MSDTETTDFTSFTFGMFNLATIDLLDEPTQVIDIVVTGVDSGDAEFTILNVDTIKTFTVIGGYLENPTVEVEDNS